MKNILKDYKEIIAYFIVGVLTTIVSLGIYYGSVLTFLDPQNGFQLQLANILSWIGAVVFAFFASRKYVFKSKEKNILLEFTKFGGSRVATLLIDMFLMFLIVTILKYSDKIAKLIVQVVVTVLNYVFSKLFVFKK